MSPSAQPSSAASSEITRQTFEGFPTWAIAVFYLLAAVSAGLFVWGVVRLVARYRRGHRQKPEMHLGRTIKVVLTHAWIRRKAGPEGLAHAAVFYGFLVLFAGTTILGIDDHIAKPLGIAFWHGVFYEVYSLFLDLFGAAMLIGLLYFAGRRATSSSIRLDYSRADGRSPSEARRRYRMDDWVFLWSLVVIAVTGFLLESLRIALDYPRFEVWSPVGHLLGSGLRQSGIPHGVIDGARIATWWVHSTAALAFVAAIPFTKAMHVLTGPGAVATRSEEVSKTLPAEPETGYRTLADLSPTHRLNLDACTKCGKCHEVCPARAAAMPLSPRDLVLDLREAQSRRHTGPLLPAVIDPKTVWSCMQCNACVDICPVGIEHVPIINLMRRGLVEDGELDGTLQSAFASIQKNGNSFGESKRKRARWTKGLDIDIADARTRPVDVLWYVGDFASLDPRNQRNTIALARLLVRAGVDVGILYDDERTAGNDVRRAGEEGLFRSLAATNIKTLSGCTFNRILTSDPHSFNTLRNEYPRLGAPWSKDQVTHHSVMLLELLDAGRLEIVNPLGLTGTYHDPCALGRYNGIFDEPRRLIERCGVQIREMPRNKRNSFCCGAGGGRIWMKDTAEAGARRPSEQRIDEALTLGGVDYFVVACPKDVTMYEDAIKTSGHAGAIELKEISELVLAATSVA